MYICEEEEKLIVLICRELQRILEVAGRPSVSALTEVFCIEVLTEYWVVAGSTGASTGRVVLLVSSSSSLNIMLATFGSHTIALTVYKRMGSIGLQGSVGNLK